MFNKGPFPAWFTNIIKRSVPGYKAMKMRVAENGGRGTSNPDGQSGLQMPSLNKHDAQLPAIMAPKTKQTSDGTAA